VLKIVKIYLAGFQAVNRFISEIKSKNFVMTLSLSTFRY